MRILSIETSCDETGIALVEADGGLKTPRFKVLKNLISSQIKIHRPFGGVVPGLAKREHLKNLPILLKKILDSRFQIPDSIDLIAVTVGPGLEPALWTGIEFAQELSKKCKKPLIGVNHMEGHLYSFLLTDYSKQTTAQKAVARKPSAVVRFPAIALIVSGGHTILLAMESLAKWEKLGETRDDAAGEAFDKVARMLELPYPGGPEIEKLSRKGDPNAIPFPRPMLGQKNYDFSFSGLKTSVFYYLRGHIREHSKSHSRKFATADLAASFQEAIVDVLTHKTIRAARAYNAKSIILCGGVAANKALRKRLKSESSKLKTHFLVPNSSFNTDNAAMIAAAGYFAHIRKRKLRLRANGDLRI